MAQIVEKSAKLKSDDDVLDAFGDLLRRQGYTTKEQVLEFMREIKREVAEEWTDRGRDA